MDPHLVLLIGISLLLGSPVLLLLYAFLTDDEMREQRGQLPSSYAPEAERPRPDKIPGRCQECGTKNDPEYVYCRKCGAKLNVEEDHRKRTLEETFGRDSS